MPSTWAAFRCVLVAAAAAAAAVVAHVAIDVAGDYVLARDAYDGIGHDSRAIFLVAIVAVALVLAARVLFDAIDRRSSSPHSLLRGLRAAAGGLPAFVVQTAAGSLLVLVAMELLDCALDGSPIDGVADLVGGSLWLGSSIALASGAVAGAIVHALVKLLADHEPAIAALLVRFVRSLPALRVASPASSRVVSTETSRARTLLLARSGSKRGPPLASPV